METLWQTQRRSMACGLLSGVFFVTAVVLSRRITGDASALSSELAACLVGISASFISILAASLPDLISDRLSRPQRTLLLSVCGVPGVMLGLSLLPAGSTIGVACLPGLFLVGVLTLTAFDSENISSIVRSSERRDVQPAVSLAAIAADIDDQITLSQHEQPRESAIRESAPSDLSSLPFDINAPVPHPSSDPETTQWMSRSVVDGLDVVEGSFRVKFTSGQRLAPVHLPFSPPLADTPEFECESADESDLRFRTTAVHAYGVRIEVSRSTECSQEETVEVAWMASAAITESVAA